MEYVMTFVKSFVKWTIILWALFFVVAFSIDSNAGEPVVKKSKSEICHSIESPYYKRTKNFTAFNSIEECLASSDKARLPKSK